MGPSCCTTMPVALVDRPKPAKAKVPSEAEEPDFYQVTMVTVIGCSRTGPGPSVVSLLLVLAVLRLCELLQPGAHPLPGHAGFLTPLASDVNVSVIELQAGSRIDALLASHAWPDSVAVGCR